uniref:Kinetochore associated 1 n=1 Tax=Neolamprologus brichardi TaxID=32507 RepID=A0A3Q4H507_NEOBR
MALWSEVELLTNEDTNTVRFDGVSREENSSGLYQVDTLVKVSSANEADPNLTSSSGSNWSFIVADRTVILFDQSYQSILLLLNFETDVDAIDVCLKGKFLVVCERNGNLHLIYVPQKRILLTRVCVVVFIFKALTLILSNRMYHMFLLIKDGFFHITNLSLAKIESGIKTCVSDDFRSCFCVFAGVRKMVVVDNLLYILDTEDVLSLWDLHFLVMIHCWPELAVHDFQLTAECGSASMVAYVSLFYNVLMKMIMLTKQDNSQISSLQIRFLPSMTVCYSLDVSFVSCLVHTKINMDAFYLVEGICENPESRREPVASVVVRSFTEALPENRLSRLLHKHMFEEAEKFAITFELDLELVYKVKLDFVLEQLASASVGGYGEDVWSELVEEAKTNLMKITVSIITVLSSSCQVIGQVAWTPKFVNGAQLLWLRYEFSESSLEAILSAIPEDLPSQDLCLWFKTVFVPFVRRVLPQGQRILAKWLEQKARNLELTEKRAWPQNGLDLAVLGLPSLWTWMKSDNSNCVEEVENLKSLVSNLRQLLDLHQKYNCSLSLSVFEKKTVWSVAFFMLDKVAAPELIAATVENSIRPYTEEHKIPFDELLLQYIKDLLERCSSQTTTLFTEWEAKAVAVLGCMTDTDVGDFIRQLWLHRQGQYLPTSHPVTSGPRLTFCHRTRALLCLVRLADAPILEAQLQIPITKIPYYLKCYIFVSQLEALNIPYTVQSFLSSPKEGLVKGLWKNHSHEPQAVRLVADLCLEYQIYDPQLWNSLLQKLLGFNLVRTCITLLFKDPKNKYQNGQHQKLLKTKHFSHLKQLIVSSGQPNQVKDLVDYLISQNWKATKTF